MAVRFHRLLAHRRHRGRAPRRPATLQLASLGLVTAALGVLVALVLWVWPHGYPGWVGAVPPGAGLTLALVLAGGAAALSLGVFVRLRRLARAQSVELGDLYAASEILRAILGTTGKGVILSETVPKVTVPWTGYGSSSVATLFATYPQVMPRRNLYRIFVITPERRSG